MMELLEWLQLLNDLEKQLEVAKNVNNIIFIGYVVLSICIKKATPLVAFLLSVLLVGNDILLSIDEVNMYLLVCVMYSFVFEICLTRQSKLACVIILLISMSFAIDARLYGASGYYGEQQSLIWNNIEYIALCAHFIFISSFVSFSGIRNSLRNFINSIGRLSLNNDYMFIYWYNVSKAIK